MKNIVFVCLFFCCSCVIQTTYVRKYNQEIDKFKGGTQKNLEIRLRSTERYSPIESVRFYVLNSANSLKLFLTLYSNPDTFYPEKIAYFKIDDEIVKLPFLNIENEKFKTTSESTKSIQLVDSTRTNVLESITTTDHFQIKFELHPDSEVVQKMQKASSLSMRIYTGGKTNTYEFTDLRDLRKVLSEE
jgi:hypothetical protein